MTQSINWILFPLLILSIITITTSISAETLEKAPSAGFEHEQFDCRITTIYNTSRNVKGTNYGGFRHLPIDRDRGTFENVIRVNVGEERTFNYKDFFMVHDKTKECPLGELDISEFETSVTADKRIWYPDTEKDYSDRVTTTDNGDGTFTLRGVSTTGRGYDSHVGIILKIKGARWHAHTSVPVFVAESEETFDCSVSANIPNYKVNVGETLEIERETFKSFFTYTAYSPSRAECGRLRYIPPVFEILDVDPTLLSAPLHYNASLSFTGKKVGTDTIYVTTTTGDNAKKQTFSFDIEVVDPNAIAPAKSQNDCNITANDLRENLRSITIKQGYGMGFPVYTPIINTHLNLFSFSEGCGDIRNDITFTGTSENTNVITINVGKDWRSGKIVAQVNAQGVGNTEVVITASSKRHSVSAKQTLNAEVISGIFETQKPCILVPTENPNSIQLKVGQTLTLQDNQYFTETAGCSTQDTQWEETAGNDLVTITDQDTTFSLIPNDAALTGDHTIATTTIHPIGLPTLLITVQITPSDGQIQCPAAEEAVVIKAEKNARKTLNKLQKKVDEKINVYSTYFAQNTPASEKEVLQAMGLKNKREARNYLKRKHGIAKEETKKYNLEQLLHTYLLKRIEEVQTKGEELLPTLLTSSENCYTKRAWAYKRYNAYIESTVTLLQTKLKVLKNKYESN